MRTGDQHAIHAIHLPLYKQLLKSTPLTKISSSLSRCPLPMKSGVGVYEDRGSSWHELGCSGLPAPWHEQLLLNTHLSKMTFSLSRCPLSTRSGVGVCEDRWSSWQVFGCLRHPDQRYKQLLTSIHFSKMSSSPSRCPMSTKSGVGVYEDRGSSWKELGCPGHFSRWSASLSIGSLPKFSDSGPSNRLALRASRPTCRDSWPCPPRRSWPPPSGWWPGPCRDCQT